MSNRRQVQLLPVEFYGAVTRTIYLGWTAAPGVRNPRKSVLPVANAVILVNCVNIVGNVNMNMYLPNLGTGDLTAVEIFLGGVDLVVADSGTYKAFGFGTTNESQGGFVDTVTQLALPAELTVEFISTGGSNQFGAHIAFLSQNTAPPT